MATLRRREFLGMAVAGSVGLTAPRLARPASTGADYDVVIVGAGVAGMTAARLLSRAGPGLKVIVLEARDRVGGRLLTLKDKEAGLPSHGVEIGSQMIHGSKADTWELVEQYGLRTRPMDSLGEPSERFLPPHTDATPDWDHLEAVGDKLRKAFAAYQGPDLSYAEFVNRQELSDFEREVMFAEALSWSAEPHRISARAVIEDGELWDDFHDEDFQIVGGHTALAERMAADIEGRIQLNSQVTDIFWRRGLAGVSYLYNGIKTSLVTRQMIVTLPIGVLQQGNISIEPALPDDVQAAIGGLEMGQAVVVPMLFSEPFWQQDSTDPQVWFDPADRRSFFFPHGKGQGGNGVTGWFVGDAALELSALGNEGAITRVLQWMEEASGRRNLAELLSWYHVEDWVSDPYSLGSYSFTRPGAHGTRAALAQGVQDTLYFAGEATAPPPHYQTTHGAYLSGKRVAAQVAKALRVGEIVEEGEEAAEEPLFQPL